MKDILVFKFGGASVKNAEGVKNLWGILKSYEARKYVVVVSAMDKTTNELEVILKLHQNKAKDQALIRWRELENRHISILNELNIGRKESVHVFELFDYGRSILSSEPTIPSVDYDRIVSIGELLSTRIIECYISNFEQIKWIDAREIIVTDSNFRNASILWEPTGRRVKRAFNSDGIYITQGFIGADLDGRSTTLGREGSDYSAAALANILKAKELTIWKDVPGIKNGDPKVFSNTVLLKRLSYEEAIELAYYGASVIHPKTIQPLKEAGIPLHVRSFLETQNLGTCIDKTNGIEPKVCCYIRKTEQWLLKLGTYNLSFISEEHLSHIYSIFHRFSIRVNLSQHSAVQSSFCINAEYFNEKELMDALNEAFVIELKKGLTLYTLKHATEDDVKSLVGTKQILLAQIDLQTHRFILQE